MADVEVLALAGCQAGTVWGFKDVFSTARRVAEIALGEDAPSMRVKVVGITGGAVKAADQSLIPVDSAIGRARAGRILIVPGCMTDPDRLEELLPSQQRAATIVRHHHARGGIVAGHCSSVFILGSAGVLAGRRATASWWAQPLFRRLFPEAILQQEDCITEDRGVICAAGPFSHYQLGLRIVEKIAGHATASLLAKFALIDRDPPHQAAFRASYLQRVHYPLAYRIELIVRRRLPEVPSVAEVAKELGVSVRTLQRNLKEGGVGGAKELVDRVRIDLAKELLEVSEMSLGDVMAAAGYRDASAFRRAFGHHTRASPSTYRRRTTSARRAPS